MDAVHWAGIYRFLDTFCAVSVLPNRTGTTKPGFDDKSVRGDMGAISTTDTNGFVHPNGLFTHVIVRGQEQATEDGDGALFDHDAGVVRGSGGDVGQGPGLVESARA